MRHLARILGIAVAVLAGACAVAAVLLWLVAGDTTAASVAGIWVRVDANSLVGLQALIENRISPSLWPPVRMAVSLPAWLVLGVVAALLLLAGRRRRHGFD